MKIAKRLDALVGKTPLLELSRYMAAHGLSEDTPLWVKLESFNPLSCVKERLAVSLIDAAEVSGQLLPDGLIIEPSSGNTGIGLAFVAAARGYRCIIIGPETMSKERVLTMQALGAQVILTPAALGMKGAIAKAYELQKENPGSVIPQQFENEANPKIHRETTAVEIWDDTDGEVDIFVAGVGTGGTITGVGEMLRRWKPTVKIIAVEPAASPVLSGGQPSPHKIQGIGAGFIPSILNLEIIDEVITVTDQQAIATTRELARLEGALVGFSSGAAVYAASLVARRPENKGKRIVVLLPDSGERYLSTILFDPTYVI